jgi:hypothetical protein
MDNNPKHSKVPRVTAPPPNDRDNRISDDAARRFNSGDIAGALAIMVVTEEMEYGNNSVLSDLGWTTQECASRVSTDSVLEQAVRDCFNNKSLDHLRQYGRASH